MWFSRIMIRGRNVPVFKKKECFLNPFRGCLGFIFQTCSKQKNLLRGKILLQNYAEFLFRGVFLRRANLYWGMFWKPLVMHVYNTSMQVPPPPPPGPNHSVYHINSDGISRRRYSYGSILPYHMTYPFPV